MKVIMYIGFILLIVLMYFAARKLLTYGGSAYRRIAYAITAFWVGIPFLLMLATRSFHLNEIDEQAWVAWVLLAVIPNALFWAVIWIGKGFIKDKHS